MRAYVGEAYPTVQQTVLQPAPVAVNASPFKNYAVVPFIGSAIAPAAAGLEKANSLVQPRRFPAMREIR